ncbi:uncharacterized protein PADG_03858 [Paracoccidioides brasiliensis Pb18]|uniref:Uncharacterized protein n=1 Tax=Paracoccidioides brasiliensis (strain Pb18) TaxID=502780 RepID=C1G9C2_PARBD|nr:uncharacterized protein PADG_03858 [Paracoccidioides brasiliensis Pb18]EEH47774.2 hypothetical protein PADG_03858 [Paracoccidioides brasiliensis Pb18]
MCYLTDRNLGRFFTTSFGLSLYQTRGLGSDASLKATRNPSKPGLSSAHACPMKPAFNATRDVFSPISNALNKNEEKRSRPTQQPSNQITSLSPHSVYTHNQTPLLNKRAPSSSPNAEWQKTKLHLIKMKSEHHAIQTMLYRPETLSNTYPKAIQEEDDPMRSVLGCRLTESIPPKLR